MADNVGILHATVQEIQSPPHPFSHISHSFVHSKDLFTLLFHVDINDLMNNKVFRFGWLMFILEKSKLLPKFPDLPR